MQLKRIKKIFEKVLKESETKLKSTSVISFHEENTIYEDRVMRDISFLKARTSKKSSQKKEKVNLQPFLKKLKKLVPQVIL